MTSKETKALRTEEENDNNVMVDEINPQASAERVPNDESEAVGADMLREKLLKNESRAENSKSYERLLGLAAQAKPIQIHAVLRVRYSESTLAWKIMILYALGYISPNALTGGAVPLNTVVVSFVNGKMCHT